MQRWQSALQVLEVGWFIGLAILLGILGGLWLDNRLSTRPLFTIVGLILGLVVAIVGAVKLIMPIIKGNDKGKVD
jgi:F0F1-type ATP synthase assembly protein I